MTIDSDTNVADRPAPNSESLRRSLDVQGIHCASCTARIEKTLSVLPGVQDVYANLATGQVSVVIQPQKINITTIVQQLKKMGFVAAESESIRKTADRNTLARQRESTRWARRTVVSAFLLVLIVLAHHLFPSDDPNWSGRIQLFLASIAQVYVGWPFLSGAWRQTRVGSANMDTLVALGTSTAYIAGVVGLIAGAGTMTFHDAVMILSFLSLGRWLEAKAKGRASYAIGSLLDLAPVRAVVLKDGQPQICDVEAIDTGETLRIHPGDKVPLDAEVTSGRSDVDESWLTGESKPIDKQEGDTVYAGTMNGMGALLARVTRTADETSLAQTIELVRRAQESKANIQRLADRVVSWFVPAIVVIAAFTWASWALCGDMQTGLICSIAVLIVACPCALGLATPMAILVASSRGAEEGILIKNAAAFEQAGSVDTVLLDKTGTVTTGQPQVVNLIPAESINESTLLAAAVGAEQLSHHPIAKAIGKAAAQAGIASTPADELTVVAGEGIVTRSQNTLRFVGTEHLLKNHQVDITSVDRTTIEEHRRSGHTVVFVAEEQRFLGAIAVSDPPVPSAAPSLRELERLGLNVALVSGDDRLTTEAIAAEVSISTVMSRVNPAGKQEYVLALRADGHRVCVVGDGINDAPALSTADVGIALGCGADIAVEAGDIVVVQHDLRKVVQAIRLSAATLRTIKQNLAWAFGYNLLLIPLAAGAIVPIAGPEILSHLPAMAAAAMATSSVCVVTNSLLLRIKPLGR